MVFFHVKFPENGWISKAKVLELKNYLPAVQKPIIPDDAEECVLSNFDPNTEKIGAESRRGEAYDSDDEEAGHHGGAQRVQCANQ